MASADKWIFRNVSRISVSAIKEMAILSAKVEGAASLAWGLPSFRTPAHIRKAVERELETDPEIGKYALPDGLPALRQLVAKTHEAGLAALSEVPLHLRQFEEILDRRRRLICERLDRLAETFDYVKPEGAYYVFPRILATHRASRAFALRLLEEARVTVTPGSAFGPSGEHHVRMAYCVPEETIECAFDRLERHFRG